MYTLTRYIFQKILMLMFSPYFDDETYITYIILQVLLQKHFD